MKPQRPPTLLECILLGLIQQQEQSGYELCKLFTTTPLGSYSDSPGAIYPALKRLEKQGLVEGREQPSGHRSRRLFRLTEAGLEALSSWLRRPVKRAEVIRDLDELLARFGFMEDTLGPQEAIRFLKELERELAGYAPELRAFLEAQGSTMSLSGRLALDSGVRSYESLLAWSRAALTTYRTSLQERP